MTTTQSKNLSATAGIESLSEIVCSIIGVYYIEIASGQRSTHGLFHS